MAPTVTTSTKKGAVRAFWEAGPCGAKHARSAEGTAEYFAQVAAKRDELEPFIPRFADFSSANGKAVLEIGVGLGSDAIRFARAGADVSGVDLTEKSIALARHRFALEGRRAELCVGDAENLPFEDGSFDVVYSWGVLHHTPDTEKAVLEVIRVLRPGGCLCVMLYGRYSWVAFALWMRHALFAGRPWRSLSSVIAERMESTGTRAFTVTECRRMFAGIETLNIRHVTTPYDRRVAGPVARWTGSWLGWFLVVRGRKPSNP